MKFLSRSLNRPILLFPGILSRNLSGTSPLGNLYPFPKNSNASPFEIFHLPKDASTSDIKKRYFELVRIYHPDTAQAQGLSSNEAEARFHAITNAYRTLQQHGGFAEGNDPLDSEAEEIKKRLAKWAAEDARREYSPYDRERRERALRAESMVGSWWKSDLTLYYLLGGAALAVAIMQIQGRSLPAQKEKVRKYLEMKRRPPPSEAPRDSDQSTPSSVT